jgi:hypothetical protein
MVYLFNHPIAYVFLAKSLLENPDTPKKSFHQPFPSDTTWKKNELGVDYPAKQRLSLSERNCLNLCERYSF